MGATAHRQEYTQTLKPLAESISHAFANQMGVEYEDVFQELMVWIVSHTRNLDEWTETKEQEEFIKMAAHSMRNAAKDHASRIKVQRLGYSRAELAWYTIKEIETLLPYVFDAESWLDKPKDDTGGRGGDPATGGNWIATLADVSRALKKVTAPEKDLLVDMYQHDIPAQVIANELGVQERTVERRRDRALLKVVEALGGERPDKDAIHPGHSWHECAGTRKVISNAAARAITSSSYQGTEQ